MLHKNIKKAPAVNLKYISEEKIAEGAKRLRKIMKRVFPFRDDLVDALVDTMHEKRAVYYAQIAKHNVSNRIKNDFFFMKMMDLPSDGNIESYNPWKRSMDKALVEHYGPEKKLMIFTYLCGLHADAIKTIQLYSASNPFHIKCAFEKWLISNQ